MADCDAKQAQSFMQNPQMQNMFANMMGNSGPPPAGGETQEGASSAPPGGMGLPAGLDFGNIMNATQQFAEQMRSENPELVENLRSQYQQGPHPPSEDDKKPDGTS